MRNKRRKIIQVKNKYQDTQPLDKLEKVGPTFPTRSSESETRAALDVAYLKQGLEGREKDSLAELRQAFEVKGTTQSYFLSFN